MAPLQDPSTSQGPAETEPLLAAVSRLPVRGSDSPSSQPYGNDEDGCLLSSQSDLGVNKTAETSFHFRVVATMFSFVVLGLVVSTTGVMVPYLEEYYGLSDLHVSLIFLAGPVGYLPAAQLNTSIHRKFGQRGIATIGPCVILLFTVAAAAHPPFVLLLVAFLAGGFGEGLLDGSWCAWAGAMQNANKISGLLHGSFSLGAAAGPFLASTLITTRHYPWWTWYCVLAVASVVELIVLFPAFRFESAEKYLKSRQEGLVQEATSHTKEALKHRITWMSAVYLLLYVGTESTISGWVVLFMTRARHTSPRMASITSSGFWTGTALGRLTLGFVTDRVGVTFAAAVYLICCMTLELGFAFVDSPLPSAVLISLLGFFMGPLFPSSIVVLTQRLPGELHIAAVSFVASVGQVGGALLPYGLGVMIELLEIRVFPVIIITQLALTFIVWIAISKLT